MSFAVDIQGATVYADEHEVLHDFSWQLPLGARGFILGPNGAGKTTLVKVLLGRLWPVFGAKVAVCGETYGTANLTELRSRIGCVSPFQRQTFDLRYTCEQILLSGFTGAEGCYYLPNQLQSKKISTILRRFNAEKLAKCRFGEISSGEQMRVLLLRALIGEPEMLILDEPTVHLDPAGREEFLIEITRMAKTLPKITMIFVTQRTEDLPVDFDQGILMKSGRIMQSGTRTRLLTEKQLSQLFDIPIRLITGNNGKLWMIV